MLEYGKPEVFRKALAKDIVDKREKVMKDAVAMGAPAPEARGGLLGFFL